MIEAVLPISNKEKVRRNLDRLNLLLESLNFFWKGKELFKVNIVTPDQEFSEISSWISEFVQAPKLDIVVRGEIEISPLLGSIVPGYGVLKQMLVKLSAFKFVQAPFCILLDSDVVICKPFDENDLIVDGRALTEWLRPSLHEWWRESARILQYDLTAEDLQKPRMFVTPQIFAEPVISALQQNLTRMYGTNWMTHLICEYTGQHPNIWTEYTLYDLFGDKMGLRSKYHLEYGDENCPKLHCMSQSLWGAKQFETWEPLRSIDGSDAGYFLVLQSITANDLDFDLVKQRWMDAIRYYYPYYPIGSVSSSLNLASMIQDADRGRSGIGEDRFNQLLAFISQASVNFPFDEMHFVHTDDDWQAELHNARVLTVSGSHTEAICRCLSLWANGCSDFLPLYDTLLSSLFNAGWIEEARDVFEQMQLLNPDTIAEMYVGAVDLKTKGWESAIDFYRSRPIPLKARDADRNGAMSLRKKKEIEVAIESNCIFSLPIETEFHGDRCQVKDFNFTIFTVADATYLSNLASSYISSVAKYIQSAHVHLLLINPTLESVEFITDLSAKQERVMITWQSVQFADEYSGNLKSICINARFLLLVDLLKSFGRPVLLTDLDFVFQSGAENLSEELGPFDFVYVSGARSGGHLPWELVHGNFVYLSNRPTGLAIGHALKCLTSETFSPQNNQSHFDQSYLSSILFNLSELAPGANVKAINEIYPNINNLYLQSSHGQSAEEKKNILDITLGKSRYPASPNLALNKPATQSSISPWSTKSTPDLDAEIATNGDIISDECFHTAEENGAWWQVDLLSEHEVAEIRIFNRRDQAGRLTRFKVVGITADQRVWTELFRKEDDHVFGSENDIPLRIEIKQPSKVRFLRVVLLGRGYLHFREFEARVVSDNKPKFVDKDERASGGTSTIPARLFQTWKSKYDFPANYHKWKETFSTHNPNFERRLWDDADNEAFISKEFPWFLKTYKGYPREIFRADVVRYFFLYKFGGIYADMDVECLRPLNALLDQGDVLLGRMGSNAAHPHSIPNAIMASKPFQDFWLLVISLLVASANKIGEPDEITGPVILKTAFDLYVADDPSVRPMIDEILALLPPALQAQSRKTKILLLDSEQWFPVDWTNPSDQMLRNEVLNVGLLSEKRKRELFPESWMVTYWTHYW